MSQMRCDIAPLATGARNMETGHEGRGSDTQVEAARLGVCGRRRILVVGGQGGRWSDVTCNKIAAVRN